MKKINQASLLSFLLMATPSIAEEVTVEVDQIPGEGGYLYASTCCAPDFFFAAEGYLPINNCAVNTSNTCVLTRTVACWLFPIPETGPEDSILSVRLNGERVSEELPGGGSLQMKFTSSDILSSAVLYDLLNVPDRVDSISWGNQTEFSFTLQSSTFGVYSGFSHVAILLYKPSVIPNYVLNFPDQAPVLEFVIDDNEPKPEPCPQDLDGSGVVDGGDLSQVIGSWGLTIDPPGTGSDINGDGVVGGADLAQILAFWGPCS